MGRSLLPASSAAMFMPDDFADAYNFLAFNQGTGEVLSHSHKAIFALAAADQREPNKAIEILNAGVAGKNLWQNQTPLPLARVVLDMLAEPWELEPPEPTHQTPC